MTIYDDLGHEIARVAYELYESSGRVDGRDVENWLEAERIVMARIAAKEGNIGEVAHFSAPKPKKKAAPKTVEKKAEPKKAPTRKTAAKPVKPKKTS